MKDPLSDYNKIALVQDHQAFSAQSELAKGAAALNELEKRQKKIREQANEFDGLATLAQAQIDAIGQRPDSCEFISFDSCEIATEASNDTDFFELDAKQSTLLRFTKLETIGFEDTDQFFLNNICCYAEKFRIDLYQSAIFNVLSEHERQEIAKRIDTDFTYRTDNCDRYDYMIAGTCGVIGGLIDIIFVGLPGEGALTKFSDKMVDTSVQKFAQFLGWRGNSLTGSSGAIAYLEKRFKINYDQQYGAATNDLLGMSTKNHHLKSIAHWPDLVGLFFSILDQFNSTSHFLDNGRLLTFDTETFELSGRTCLAKIFAGFVNWVGHLFSDIAGSSAAQGRGAGIPMPFYGLLQLLGFGSLGAAKKTIADIAVEVFEKGYDFRHGIAMSIPVAITEISVRFMWSLKSHLYHKNMWKDCIPSEDIPEVRRMLLVGHGTLCFLDGLDASLRSGGEVVTMLLRMNAIAWVRFGLLSIKELHVFLKRGHLDQDKIDTYLLTEYKRLLA